MLPESTVRLINEQIEQEIENLNSIMSMYDDKAAIVDRITKLTAALTPQTDRQELLSELAAAIVEAQNVKVEVHAPSTLETFVDVVGNFRRR